MVKNAKAGSKSLSDVKNPSGGSPFGGQARQVVTPSGHKLIFTEDSEAILVFIGKKDISDRLGKPAGSVLYLTFYDGAKMVSMPSSYMVTKAEFQPERFYYLHCVSLVPMKGDFNDMKDFVIWDLGVEGDTVPDNKKISGEDTFELTLQRIEFLNYNRLNYPLRKKAIPEK
jgi:hypothetical protein